MMIKMYQWELMDAIENHIRNNLKSEINFDSYDVTVIAEQMIPIWKDKKHKNGKDAFVRTWIPRTRDRSLRDRAHLYSRECRD